MVREADIRRELCRRLALAHAADPDTLLVEELGLCQGDARIDVALVNGQIHGFEIKSADDTLERLPGQLAAYSRVLDRVTVVAASRHQDDLRSLVPPWWGIIEASGTGEAIALAERRPATDNPAAEVLAVAQLLWRDEALQLLEVHDLATGFRSKPRMVLWRRLAQSLPPEVLGDAVRARLRSREGWRSASPPA